VGSIETLLVFIDIEQKLWRAMFCCFPVQSCCCFPLRHKLPCWVFNRKDAEMGLGLKLHENTRACHWSSDGRWRGFEVMMMYKQTFAKGRVRCRSIQHVHDRGPTSCGHRCVFFIYHQQLVAIFLSFSWSTSVARVRKILLVVSTSSQYVL